MQTKLTDTIFWVGHVDWNVRDFHGYETGRGSTYNAYFIRDDRPALIDTVKYPFSAELLASLGEVADPSRIAYVVCNHAEPDHSSSLPAVLQACPRAELVCNAKCRDALSRLYDTAGWKFHVVQDGDTLALGRHTLKFVDTPMAHWPESMATLVVEDGILFSMDAFGQHYASSGRFDDEVPLETVLQELKVYYANILMCYPRPVRAAMDKLAGIRINLIAPSHGVIWRKHIPDLLKAYTGWTDGNLVPKVLVMYDTMWQSTAKMAEAIVAGAEDVRGVDVQLLYVRANHITTLATEALDAPALAFGSATLNMGMMPQAAAALNYLKGLKPPVKFGLAFGSYGWGKSGAEAVEEELKSMGLQLTQPAIKSLYAPTPAILAAGRAAGRVLAEKALAAAKEPRAGILRRP